MLHVVVDTEGLTAPVEEERRAHKLEASLGCTARWGGSGDKTGEDSASQCPEASHVDQWNVHSQSSTGPEISHGYHTNQQFNSSKDQEPKIYLVAELLLGIAKPQAGAWENKELSPKEKRVTKLCEPSIFRLPIRPSAPLATTVRLQARLPALKTASRYVMLYSSHFGDSLFQEWLVLHFWMGASWIQTQPALSG